MTSTLQLRHHRPLASIATVAVLATLSTPVFAQEVDPGAPAVQVASPPEAAAPATAPAAAARPPETAPVIPLAPEATPAPVVVAPVAAAPEQPVAQRPAAQARAKAAPRATAPTTRAVAAAPAKQPASAAGPVTEGPSTGILQAAPEAAVPLVRPPAQARGAATADNSGGYASYGLVALGLVVVAGGTSVYALRRRRRIEDDSADEYAPAPQAVATGPEPVLPETEIRLEPVGAPGFSGAAGPIMAGGPIAHGGKRSAEVAAVPPGPVPTGAARAALIERMTRAAPDETNPFVSPKRRRRKARMLVNQREQELREAATQPFDFRSYRPSSQRARDEGLNGARTRGEPETTIG